MRSWGRQNEIQQMLFGNCGDGDAKTKTTNVTEMQPVRGRPALVIRIGARRHLLTGRQWQVRLVTFSLFEKIKVFLDLQDSVVSRDTADS